MGGARRLWQGSHRYRQPVDGRSLGLVREVEDPSARQARGSLLLPACLAAQKRFFDLGLIERSLPTFRRKGDLAALSDEHDLCLVGRWAMDARGGK